MFVTTSFSPLVLTAILTSSLLVSPVVSAESSGSTLEIGSAEDLITFSSSVNSGTNYSGTTILLTDDIYFDSESSDRFYPIGNWSNNDNSFRGVFDGQGYTINNLKIAKGNNYFSLFGSSKGGTIKNVILSSSCEIVCKRNYTPYVSGIIGSCSSGNGESCSVLNCVNMASVSYNEICIGPPLYIGGIAGYFQGSVKNCGNFGTITVNGEIGSANVGGIVGYTSLDTIILNCINHGTIFHNGNTSNLFMGGISGYIYSKLTINNCVSMGEISVGGTVSGSSYIGSIIGNITSGTTIYNCYWDDSINYPCYGSKGDNSTTSNISSFNANTLQLSEAVTVGGYTGKSLIHALNAFTNTEANLSQWAENGNAPRGVSFFINNRSTSIFTTGKKVILLPNLADGTDNMFHGWFTDVCLRKPFDNMTIPDGTTTLYGRYGDFTPQQQEQCEVFSSSSSSSSSKSSLHSSSFSSFSSSSSNPTPSEYVEIVFGKKNITKEEAIEIIKEFTGNDDFEIVEFEDTDDGKRIIVKFEDVEEATNFIESVEESSEETRRHIQTVRFIDGLNSFSLIASPFSIVLVFNLLLCMR